MVALTSADLAMPLSGVGFAALGKILLFVCFRAKKLRFGVFKMYPNMWRFLLKNVKIFLEPHTPRV